MRTVLVVLVLSLLGGSIAILANLGLFTPIKVEERRVGPFPLVYEEHVGDYQKTGPIVDRVCNSLKAESQLPQRGFGIFLDNPHNTKKEQLRSLVGCILSEQDQSKIEELSQKHKTRVIPPFEGIAAEFPYQNPLSFIIGTAKAYPAMQKYLSQKGYRGSPALEIYDLKEKKIIYIMAKDGSPFADQPLMAPNSAASPSPVTPVSLVSQTPSITKNTSHSRDTAATKTMSPSPAPVFSPTAVPVQSPTPIASQVPIASPTE